MMTKDGSETEFDGMNAKCKNRPFVNYYGRVIFNVEENAVKDLTHSPSLSILKVFVVELIKHMSCI